MMFLAVLLQRTQFALRIPGKTDLPSEGNNLHIV